MEQDVAWQEQVEQDLARRQRNILKQAGLIALLALAAVASYYYLDRQAHFSEKVHLARAEAFLKGEQLQAAVIELKNAMQANPRNQQTRLSLADTYLKQGLGAEAEEQLDLARKSGAAPGVLALPLAEAMLLQQKYDKVLQEIRPDAPELANKRRQAMRLRADALLGLGRIEEACPMFRQVLQDDPRQVPAHWGLVRCAVAKRDFEDAMAHVNAALKIEPHNLRSLMLKGEVAQAMGDFSGADAAYGLALATDPGNVDTLLARAMARLAADKPDLATKDVMVAQARAPKSLAVRYMQALLAYRQGRLEEAQNLILGVVGKLPDHLPSRVLSGYVAYRLGQYYRADMDLTSALASSPESRNVRLALANSRLKSGQPEGALAVLEPLLSESELDPEILVTAADAYLKMGDQSKAAEVMGKTVALNPKEPALRAKIGLGRLLAGDREGATREFDAAAKLGAPSEQTLSWRIMAHLTRREYDSALKLAEELVKQAPDSAVAHHLKGMVYLGRQDLVRARQSFEQALKIKPTGMTAARSLARLDLQQGNPSAARARYEAMLKQAPKHYEAMMELALLARVQDRDAEYILWLTRAAEAAPQETSPRLTLARHYLAKRRPDKALAWARQAHDLDPRNPNAMELLGDAQFASGDKNSAAYTYLQWTLVTPKSATANYKLGWSQMVIGQSLSAKESLDRALNLQPEHTDAAVALTVLALNERRHKDALALARRIQHYHPNNWQGYSLEGDSHASQGQHAEAAKAYAQALALNRNSQLFVRLHQALTQAGKVEQAHQAEDSWFKASPQDVVARLYLGYALLHAGRNAPAVAHFQGVLKLDANNADALAGMAAALHAQKVAGALQYAEKAYAQSGGSAGTSYLLGRILVAQNETRRGLELLQRAVTLDPRNPGYRFTLAAAWAQSGKKALAREWIESLLSTGDNFPQRAEAQALLQSLPNTVAKSNGKR
jgi:putative PEP-CTERM system TPR-repeat lipoprotein